MRNLRPICPGGEIGRRDSFRFYWIHVLVGSSPVPGTLKCLAPYGAGHFPFLGALAHLQEWAKGGNFALQNIWKWRNT